MAGSETKTKVLNGLFWKVMENGGSQGIQFLVSVILARLLSPEEYGVVAIITIFITIANVLVQNGFSTALIQKQNVDDADFSSVFFFNLITSAVIYVCLFAGAPWIAAFYHNEEMTAVIRVLSIILFPGGVTSIQNAYISRKLEFKGLFLATLGAAVVSGGVSIAMAFGGMGVWALAWQQITYYFSLMIILFVTVSWRPKLLFAFDRIRVMFSFGWKLLCASLIDTIFNNLHGLIMGKIYNEEVLGYYNRGDQFPKLIVNNLSAAIQSVMLPVLAASQNDLARVKSMLRRSIVTSSYLVLPMMAGMIAVADSLVLALLGEKWMFCVPFLRIMCVAYSFWPIHIANLQALNAVGRSDIFLKLEVIKKAVGLAVLVIGIRYSAIVLVALKAVADFICTFINAWPNKKLLNYSIGEQWIDILPSIVVSCLMGILVYLVQHVIAAGWLCLFVQIVAGIVVYAGLSWLFRLESFEYLKRSLLERL